MANEIINTKVTESEWNRVKISGASTRPNAKSAYGNGLSASDTKEMFDAPSKLLVYKHNALVDILDGVERIREKNEAERAEAEKERQDNEEMRKEFYKTAFVGKKSNYVGGGVFNTESDTANDYNLANARAATTFGFDNRIVNNEDDLKATHAHQLFKDDYVPAENKDSNLNESKWGRHSFLAGARNVLTAYSGVGLGQDNKICGYQAVAIGYALRAYSARQLVVGKWNKPDVPPDKDSTAYGDYAFIVGNGSSTDPSNAFAVRWDGEVELSDGKTIEKHINEAVDSAVAALVGSAPETMNTIGEIAKMIDDPDSAADILGRLAVLDEQMGTVDEALDSIITIQNELIGGEA